MLKLSHTSAPHYAKGMCSNCYHSKGRSKKPWNCVHVNKAHYALGLCQNCYQMAYIKKNLESKSFKGDNIILNDKKKTLRKKMIVVLIILKKKVLMMKGL